MEASFSFQIFDKIAGNSLVGKGKLKNCHAMTGECGMIGKNVGWKAEGEVTSYENPTLCGFTFGFKDEY